MFAPDICSRSLFRISVPDLCSGSLIRIFVLHLCSGSLLLIFTPYPFSGSFSCKVPPPMKKRSRCWVYEAISIFLSDTLCKFSPISVRNFEITCTPFPSSRNTPGLECSGLCWQLQLNFYPCWDHWPIDRRWGGRTSAPCGREVGGGGGKFLGDYQRELVDAHCAVGIITVSNSDSIF